MGSITIRILGIGIAILSLSIGAMVKPAAAANVANITHGHIHFTPVTTKS